MNKLEILKSSVQQRTDEITMYQINIDNYTRIIEKIADDWCGQTSPYRDVDIDPLRFSKELYDKVGILKFKDKIKRLLANEVLEQTKTKLILEVIEDQLREAEHAGNL